MAQRKIYTIDKLSGVKLSQGGESNPSYARNMIVKDGIARKRKKICTISEAIPISPIP